MKNPLNAITALFTGGEPSPAPLPSATGGEAAIKVEVPADVVEAATIKPKVPHESFKQHNRDIEQRVKAANLHRPVPPRAMPHARGR